MPLAATGDLVTAAAGARTAVAAFNIITLEHVEAVIAGAESVAAPVVLQVSENAVKFRYGRLLPLARAAAAAAERASVPVALHLDHVQSDDLLRQASAAGFSSVMYDAARLPYEENLAATRAAADWAHAQGLWIEAELGAVGGKNGEPPLDAHAPGARTDPAEARAFVADSGVDALAVAIGSSHAMTTRTAALDHDRLKRLTAALGVPLVLHGSSGVPDDELAAAVAGGIAKVNVGTALNIAMTGAVREFLAAHPEAVDSRKYLSVGREAMAETVARLIRVLGA
ncbi:MULTISPECIES: class II fructose-bisphosphate aldolase [Streptomyces]|uniref:Class II fructose-bisphosphate aldolase family protein n=1 Tax=Streptomyces mirabilis TaxID=68239 RepID=A0ABU3UZS7_9ACTN|nr:MULTISPECIES: class II fructose-bisphosphate aldolase [Streptomyces]MDU8999438.1 class II fructose-bisphosphate aldolase family protein [Streptomyces mirabilis]QDN76274.1 class II fructose-bisphosphate aldolase family protein [Streptomyces sp. S1A1-7]QDN96648.1 class II fructose-bisphosphate aldolase family protein [Streptomyces sp. RLB1-9]QDO18354.1 class II fructose-bisphosphate aldolase family protein [Streptomyces sp. S1A1-8]QDO28482.1 class II fructose-bisphosphate aldolase family prot